MNLIITRNRLKRNFRYMGRGMFCLQQATMESHNNIWIWTRNYNEGLAIILQYFFGFFQVVRKKNRRRWFLWIENYFPKCENQESLIPFGVSDGGSHRFGWVGETNNCMEENRNGESFSKGKRGEAKQKRTKIEKLQFLPRPCQQENLNNWANQRFIRLERFVQAITRTESSVFLFLQYLQFAFLLGHAFFVHCSWRKCHSCGCSRS